MRVVVAIMCGGAGTRFWPASVKENPKQFLSIFKDQPLIMDAYNRATRVTAPENVYMITTKHLEPKIKEVFPQMCDENVIYEPGIRSTAPCLSLGALYLKNIDPDTIMVVLPADHIIPDHAQFEKTISQGVKYVEGNGGLVTVGVVPTMPETGFGYIKVNEDISTSTGVMKVEDFKEKPELKVAEEYVDSKQYFWNAGMFIWKVEDFMNELKTFSKSTYDEVIELEKPLKDNNERAIGDIYNKLTTDSIDYALMEKSPNVYVVPASFGWNDVGHWLALEEFGEELECGKGNVKEMISINSDGNVVYAPNKLVATMDLKNMIVIDTPKSIMIIPKEKAQNVKELLNIVKSKKLTDYL
jgi:mannose-1-phosphate guanylyltransferase